MPNRYNKSSVAAIEIIKEPFHGKRPEAIYDIINEKAVGTLFAGRK